MDIEYDIMWQIMRVGASARRKTPGKHDTRKRHNRGYGHILDLLAINNGMRQQQIADSLHIRQQSVSEALKVLESQGLVCKQPDENDRRCSLIYITQAGLEHRIEVEKERITKAKEILSCLSDEEKKTLRIILCKVTDAIKKKDEVN